jgi:hypothetical protein
MPRRIRGLIIAIRTQDTINELFAMLSLPVLTITSVRRTPPWLG